jgi:hypothetical protein
MYVVKKLTFLQLYQAELLFGQTVDDMSDLEYITLVISFDDIKTCDKTTNNEV